MDGNRILYKGKEVAFPLELGLNVIDGRGAMVKLEGSAKNEPMFFKGRDFDVTPRAVLLHHTAGEGGHKGLFHTLEQRGLSVHFGIDAKGRIIQYADAATRCSHAGTANSYTVGIEISCRGRAPALPKFPRASYEDRCHSRPVKYLMFYPEQVDAAHRLCTALCQLLGIPYKFPMDNGKVSRLRLPDSELSNFHGLLGHLHVSDRKIDPSPHLMDELASR